MVEPFLPKQAVRQISDHLHGRDFVADAVGLDFLVEAAEKQLAAKFLLNLQLRQLSLRTYLLLKENNFKFSSQISLVLRCCCFLGISQ